MVTFVETNHVSPEQCTPRDFIKRFFISESKSCIPRRKDLALKIWEDRWGKCVDLPEDYVLPKWSFLKTDTNKNHLIYCIVLQFYFLTFQNIQTKKTNNLNTKFGISL